MPTPRANLQARDRARSSCDARQARRSQQVSLVVCSPGRLPERTNGAASKAVVASGSPWVRIPHLPLKAQVRDHIFHDLVSARSSVVKPPHRRTTGVPQFPGSNGQVRTGLPVSWVERDTTWWEWSREWLSVKWPQWAGHSRRSAVESLVALTPLMSRHGAPYAPDNVATWLREHGYRPGSASQENLPSWLLTWSVPLSEIDVAQLERVLTAVTTKLDGAPMSGEWPADDGRPSMRCCAPPTVDS